jgi:serine/threonine protein phosphatase PrpC
VKAFQVQVAQRSCVGSRSRNEDCLAVERQSGHWCLVLSDGAGGHGDGARAAQLAVERVLAGFRSRPPVDARDLSELLLDAHDAVVAGQRERAAASPHSAMHATVVVLTIDTGKGVALWGHVGDSRLYQWRAGRLDTVTRDDSVLQWVLDTGLADAERMQKITNRGVLLSALGSAEEVVPHVSAPFELKRSDAFLLCSDGWWGALDREVLSQSLNEAAAPEQWLEAMMALTQQRADPRQDNFSAIACWIGEPLDANEGECATEAETIPPRSAPALHPR